MGTKTAKGPKTKTTQTEQFILSGMFALTNMGQSLPKDVAKVIERMRSMHDKLSLMSAMMAFCQEYMESDEHQKMFFEEAAWWYRDKFSKPKWTREEITRVWPDNAEALWPSTEPKAWKVVLVRQSGKGKALTNTVEAVTAAKAGELAVAGNPGYKLFARPTEV